MRSNQAFFSFLSYLRLSAFICGCIFLTACSDTIKTSDEDLKQLQYPELVAMLKEKPDEGGGVLGFLNRDKRGPTVLLDPRTEARFAKEHLPGAINIPMPSIVQGDERLANAKRIVVYGSGSDWNGSLSSAAAKRLMALGYSNVYDFRGGIEQWKNNGGRIESGAPATQPKP